MKKLEFEVYSLIGRYKLHKDLALFLCIVLPAQP
jgi:hypothetical protein